MLETVIATLNTVAATIAASLLNTAATTCVGVTLAVLLSGGKAWSAATRHALWWLMLLFVIAAPVVSALLPDQHPQQQINASAVTITPRSEVVFTPTAAIHPGPARSIAHLSVPALLLLCWCAAFATQWILLLRGFFHGLALKRNSQPPAAPLLLQFKQLREQARVHRKVTLRESQQLAVPAAIGYFRPAILIPDLTSSLNSAEVEQVLLHELAHIARYDDWKIAIQRSIEAAFIWHPLVRFLSRRLSRDREMICDDFVTSRHEPIRYADCLAKIAEIHPFRSAQAVLVPLLERKSELLARVEMLLDKTRAHKPEICVQRVLLTSAALYALAVLSFRTPKLMALPASESLQTGGVSTASIQSIIITTEDGRTSLFDIQGSGSWSGHSDESGRREPGTITFKANGKSFLIRDKAVLEQARKLLQPMEDLGRQQSALGEQQSKLGEQQSRLGEKQSGIANRPLSAEQAAKLAKQLQDLKERIDEVNAKSAGQAASEAQEHLGALQSLLGELQSGLGVEQSKNGAAQSELAALQADLGVQQEILGKQQGELGARQATESKQAQDHLQKLIREAQSRGLAHPLPD